MTKWLGDIRGLTNISVPGARVVRPHSRWKGTTAVEELVRFCEENPGARFDRVIVMFGTNDVRHDKRFCESSSLDRVYRALCDLVCELRRRFGNPEIVVGHLIPLRPDYDFTVRNVVGFNRVINSVADRLRCSVWGATDDFLGPEKKFYRALFCRDGVHLNRNGYSFLRDLVIEHFYR